MPAATTRPAATTSIGREADGRATSDGSFDIACAIEDLRATADGDTALQRGLRGTADNEGIATAGRCLEGEGLAADGEGIPFILIP